MFQLCVHVIVPGYSLDIKNKSDMSETVTSVRQKYTGILGRHRGPWKLEGMGQEKKKRSLHFGRCIKITTP